MTLCLIIYFLIIVKLLFCLSMAEIGLHIPETRCKSSDRALEQQHNTSLAFVINQRTADQADKRTCWWQALWCGFVSCCPHVPETHCKHHTSYQHICICVACSVLRVSARALTTLLSRAWKLHEGKVNTSALAVARPACHAWWEMGGIEQNSRRCFKHLLVSKDSHFLPVYWSLKLGLKQIYWDILTYLMVVSTL